jgi:LuxR family maltose regulon positive regulatory protein
MKAFMPADSLLKTKLHIPPIRPELVSRPRLIERLEAGLDRRLTLISAPAGFGKTTLLSECAARCGLSVSWLSLDGQDNSPTRFWIQVIAAMQTLYDGVGSVVLEALQMPRTLPNETLLGQLINQIADIPHPVALIVDDLHVITNPQIHEQLVFLMDHAPAQMHLVVSSRADPPWPLARWRARGQVVELRMDDLRFTSEETAAFLNDVMGLDLSLDDVVVLGARTEGWIAGLQLAALSMKDRDPRSFVRAFSGSHRFILDYLVEEVLDRQPANIQEFLLQTSIFERLTASLCDAVRFGSSEALSHSEGQDSQAILERLEQANLFLVPLDDERRWYRYHHLFADLLRNRLERYHGERVATLHRRASAWCEGQGLLSEAVRHALIAGDIDGVVRMAKQDALATMDHGELRILVGLLDALPEEVVNSRPWLCIAHAWALVFSGRLESVEARVRSTETTLTSSGNATCAEGPVLSSGEEQHIAGHIAAIRAYVATLRGDMSRAAELIGEALEELPEEDLAVRGLASSLLGSVLRWSGDLLAAAQSLDSSMAIAEAAGDRHTTVETLCSLAAVQLAQGQLHNTLTTCRDALLLADEHVKRGGRRLPIAATGHNLMSQVLHERNDLEGALRHAREGIGLSEQWGWSEGLALGYWRLSRVLQATGDANAAHEAIQKARRSASDVSSWFGALMATHQARLWLVQGHLAPASHWAQDSGLNADDELSYQRVDGYGVLARVLIAQGRLDEASRLLARLAEVTEAAGAISCLIEMLALQALALQAQGKHDQAMTALERGLTLAEPEGFVRTFMDVGPQMGQLLRRAVGHGIFVDYAGMLLRVLEEEATRATKPPFAFEGTRTPLVEPLSPRETEVLRLLTTHLSHAEIAEDLVVSVNTVRSHVKSIYGKLDVHSRLEAVERARELGLLD